MVRLKQLKKLGPAVDLVLLSIIIILIGAIFLQMKGNGSALGEGDTAPDFMLKTLDGQPVSLSEWRGGPVLVNFWASWCGPCKIEMPAIQAAYDEHKRHGFVVLAVTVNDSAENAKQFFEAYDLTFPLLMDDGQVSNTYQVVGLPTSYFVGRDGRITAVHVGGLTEETLAVYLGETMGHPFDGSPSSLGRRWISLP